MIRFLWIVPATAIAAVLPACMGRFSGGGPMHHQPFMMPFFGGGFMWVLILAGIVVLAYVLYRRNNPSKVSISSMNSKNLKENDEKEDDESPMEILKKRYAAGEITRAEFEEMKKELET
jgi:putative membrane protein